jgi:hypothetical protein
MEEAASAAIAGVVDVARRPIAPTRAETKT